MSFGIVEPGKLLGVAAGPVKRWLRREEPPGERVLWIRLLSEGSRWSVSGGALSGLLIFGGTICYAFTTMRPSAMKARRSWTRIWRKVMSLFGWDEAVLVGYNSQWEKGMSLVSQLEGKYEIALRHQLQNALREVLNEYHPTCSTCGTPMYRDHSYSRSFLSRHGELRLEVPVFRCSDCGGMASGMDIIGAEAARHRVQEAP